MKTTPWNKIKAFIQFLREYETVLAQKDYGKSVYNSMRNAIINLGKEYGLWQITEI